MMKCKVIILTAMATVVAACIAAAQQPPAEESGPGDGPQIDRRSGRGDRQPGRPARKITKSGVVKEFCTNPDGATDGLLFDDGTEVKFPPSAAKALTQAVSANDRVTITGWNQSGESEIHAATIKHEASGKVIIVDRAPPEISQDADQPRPGESDDAAKDRPPSSRPDEGQPPRPRPGKYDPKAPAGPNRREKHPPERGPGSQYTLEQAVSDEAQLRTIAFDGLAFLTGDFAADTFLPPGKVSDYFGFQYMRDIDAKEGGHNTSFLTRIAYNMLAILDDRQKTQLMALAKEQETNITRFAAARFPLIKAFRRNLQGDLPTDSKGLSRDAVVKYSADLYELDGLLAWQRAKVMGSILHDLSARQKAALARLKFGDSRTWPDVPEPLDRRSLPHTIHVAVMTYASEMFAWYTGSVEADVYFCPERHGMYFGGFGMKTAPAMGKQDYSISTSLTGDSGEAFLGVLSEEQRKLITNIVDQQREKLAEIIKTRRAIAVELRRFLKGEMANMKKVLALSRRYGELDGEMSYFYATAFAKVGQTLSTLQKQVLAKMRTSDPADVKGPFLYSAPIDLPSVRNTDFLFGRK